MVFPSIPAYPDPSNWQQHQPSSNQHQSGGFSPQLLQPPPQAAAGGGGMDWVRPGSLVERARLANIPMPQVPLKCPRCDSTNTKFCYFNNYSLSQPRHFCKTCRRYWTRGGALRRVPVGGGCRRNKRSRAAAAKSALFATTISSTTEPASNLLGLPPQFQQLRFTAPLSQTADYSSGGHDMGFNFTGMVAAGPDLNTPAGTNFLGELATLLPNGGGSGFEPWRLQPPQPNFPFLGGFDQPPPPPPAGVFLFQSGVEFPGYAGEQSSPGRPKHLSQTLTATVSSVKVEDSSHQEPNMGMQLMGIPGSDQWSSIAWTDLSNFTSSSTTNPI